MDRVRAELLPPILIREMHRAARRQALADLAAPPHGRFGPAVLARVGAALIRTGCRMEAAGWRLARVSPSVAAAPCGCGA